MPGGYSLEGKPPLIPLLRVSLALGEGQGYALPMKQFPPAIMVQGTSSNAGKSLLTAALCRIYARKGLRVAPFKAQNMTSYACELPGGLRMSGAQVLQGIAAGRPPSTAMNPVLLLPRGAEGSEVVVQGRSHGVMPFGDYTQQKEAIFSHVAEAYASLAHNADLMLIEGAGSPAEINLQANDIVNMRMARFAGAQVLLVGDIDRGGVFAHLYGTWLLVPEEDRRRIAGFVLNKFRGDAALLAPANQEITRRTGVPFMAVVPALNVAGLPEEDSLSLGENTDGAVLQGHIGNAGQEQPPAGKEYTEFAELTARYNAALERLADGVEAAFAPGVLDTLARGAFGKHPTCSG